MMSEQIVEQIEVSSKEELDLGIEPPVPQIDYEAGLAKTKPDFQRMAKLLGIQPQGSTQEEVEADLLSKQQALEADLKTNLVPKVQAALQSALSKASGNSSPTTKPGVSVSTTSTEPRKTKAWRGY